MEPPISLSPQTVAELTREQIAAWLHRRLHGRDSLAPLDPRIDDFWHVLFRDLYFAPEFDGDFRRALRGVILDALSDALGTGELAAWRDPEAVNELLMLAPDLLSDGTASELTAAAGLLQEGHRRLPWRAPRADGSEIRLRLRGLIAFVELRWDRIPPDRHPDTSFWESLWEPEATDPASNLHRFAGEQAALIFQGLCRTQRVTGSGLPGRYRRTEAAFRWLGRVRPWREEFLLQPFSDLLKRSLLGRVSNTEVFSLLIRKCSPTLPNESIRQKVFTAFAKVAYPDKKGAVLYPRWLAGVVRAICPTLYLMNSDDESCLGGFEDDEHDFVEFLVLAAEEAKLAGAFSPNHHPLRKIDGLANFLRACRVDLEHPNHRFHTRYLLFQSLPAALHEIQRSKE